MNGKQPPPQPPQMPQIQVDITKAKDVLCDNCGNVTFQEVALLKEFSAITSPTGKPGIVPIPVFACNACGFVNNQFLPPQLRKGGKIEATNLESPVAKKEEPASPPKLTIV